MKPNATTMAYGSLIFLATLGVWLYGELNGLKTDVVWTFATPLVLALFLGQGIAAAAENAQKAAEQTNGTLAPRIKAAVAEALSDRDAARTRQQLGDVGAVPLPARADYSEDA